MTAVTFTINSTEALQTALSIAVTNNVSYYQQICDIQTQGAYQNVVQRAMDALLTADGTLPAGTPDDWIATCLERGLLKTAAQALSDTANALGG